MAKSDLHYVENPVIKVEGALTPGEAAAAIVAGQNAPERLSFDPRHPDYDAQWCRMVRGVGLVKGFDEEKQEPIIEWLDDVIGFDIPRHVVYQLVRGEHGNHLFEPARPGQHMPYKRRELEGQVTVQYGIPVDPPEEDRRTTARIAR